MRQRQRNTLELTPDESIVLSDQACIKDNPRSGWKPGYLWLTNKRLVHCQSAQKTLEISPDAILGVTTEKKRFILRSTDALSISFLNPRTGSPSSVWIVAKDPEKWQETIFYSTNRQVSEKEIEKVASELDPHSRCILLHVWEERHAAIQDLSGLYDAPSHMDVLQRIRDIINPLSEKIVGFPILVFERSKSDPLTGGKVLFSWWILGDRGGRKESVEPLIDLFEEEDHIIVLTEVRGIENEDIQVTISGDHFNISCDSPTVTYSEDILLPATVDPDTARKRYNNGILEIKVQKSLMEKESIPEEREPAPEFNSGLNA